MVKELDSTFSMNKDSVVASPVDEILEAVVIKIRKGLHREFLDERVWDKFDNLDDEMLEIHFETKYNDRVLGGKDKIRFYDEPMVNSNLGKFIMKYGELKVGSKMKVEYNSDGFPHIKVK